MVVNTKLFASCLGVGDNVVIFVLCADIKPPAHSKAADKMAIWPMVID